MLQMSLAVQSHRLPCVPVTPGIVATHLKAKIANIPMMIKAITTN